ncbi:restriction endonuclease [Stakelama tenebrarum]|uniref:Restriction endonuclease n=1 Tax=Stakelama tenebrarum TaxID=2711215 RepID=A0A6G6Y3S5_9SPHN|nr:restriction endonuclease [Sphingosinithalassobacter tenebrarum]QIG79216.1 restriction endonuclease [Sphingosinithalassobacter tenebrarum]
MTVAIPAHEELMLPTMRVLDAHGGSASNEEIQEALIEMLGLTPEQMDVTYPTSGVQVVPDRMSWARSYLKYPGFVDNPRRAVWVLTEEGRAALDWDEAAIRKAVARGYAERQKARAASEAMPDGDPEADDGAADWNDTLLATLRGMDPAGFERLAQRLLRESGFVRVEVSGRSGDGGIDGSGVLRMNLISFQVLFQCKRYTGSVGSSTVRDFRGAMQGRADKGLIITTGTFTADARREATRDGAPAIDLIDGEALCELLKERRLGVRVREVVREEVDVLPEFFAEI